MSHPVDHVTLIPGYLYEDTGDGYVRMFLGTFRPQSDHALCYLFARSDYYDGRPILWHYKNGNRGLLSTRLIVPLHTKGQLSQFIRYYSACREFAEIRRVASFSAKPYTLRLREP